MNKIQAIFFTLALFFLYQPANAEMVGEDNFYPQESSAALKKIAKYLANLGSYLGFNLEKQGDVPVADAKLLDVAAVQVNQNYMFNTLLGAQTVNTQSDDASKFIPSSNKLATINGFINYTFRTQPYDSPAGNKSGKVSVSELIDQKTYQKDPVSQSLLNILGTPSDSYCMNYQGNKIDENCKLLYDTLVSKNVIGEYPNPREFFSYKYNEQFLSQLNGDSLITPLLYSQNEESSSGATPIENKSTPGLTANNQAQVAANFVRYATSLVEPIALPKLKQYSEVYAQAKNLSGKVSDAAKSKAQTELSKYLTSLRVYTAQASVAFSNLYYMLSKRMPQNQSASGSNVSSQALSEFTMATWRLYNPDSSSNKQWLTQINNASSATVQKEIATLLAEINYQLYLNRQQQERLLLTQTILLIQNTKAGQPFPNLNNQSIG